ncbi:hypothetical protein Ctob_011943 [Chrysochromulina tobinii]|uniref:Tudor domain-containing protein n=1 Tax=Chrysochromulina tobinii TaxID=1460289 RepID=A0A0M0KAR3_9EUKA|nr:hypothetical protein Ctob_011943 [Chrysochromulina tobinii]|eukprot:KOO35483.1 hypothetical protein Ctob_011943 [Chrysochromulina sp. CCMP291]
MSDEDVGEESDEDADGNCDHVEEGDEDGVEDGDEEGDEEGVEDGDEDGDEEDVGEEGADGRVGSALGTHLCGKDGCSKPVWHSGICTSVLGYRRDQKPVQMYTAEPAPSPRELMRQARNEGRLPPSKKPMLGDRVRGKYQGQIGGRNWFDGVVTAVHEDGSCDLHYDDGDCEERVAPRSSLHSSLHSSSLDGEWTCANSVLRAYSCEDDESEYY